MKISAKEFSTMKRVLWSFRMHWVWASRSLVCMMMLGHKKSARASGEESQKRLWLNFQTLWEVILWEKKRAHILDFFHTCHSHMHSVRSSHRGERQWERASEEYQIVLYHQLESVSDHIMRWFLTNFIRACTGFQPSWAWEVWVSYVYRWSLDYMHNTNTIIMHRETHQIMFWCITHKKHCMWVIHMSKSHKNALEA